MNNAFQSYRIHSADFPIHPDSELTEAWLLLMLHEINNCRALQRLIDQLPPLEQRKWTKELERRKQFLHVNF